jgi:hypothetical protein
MLIDEVADRDDIDALFRPDADPRNIDRVDDSGRCVIGGLNDREAAGKAGIDTDEERMVILLMPGC